MPEGTSTFAPQYWAQIGNSRPPRSASTTSAIFGERRRRSSAASCSQSFSASGSFMEVLFEQELGGDRVDPLALHSSQSVLGFHRGIALVDTSHRQMKAAFELAREAFDAL